MNHMTHTFHEQLSRGTITPSIILGDFNEDVTHTVRISNRRQRERRSPQNPNSLRRFLLAQVGRPWNNVYSDICYSNSRRQRTRQESQDVIDGYVEQNVQIIDGVACNTDGKRLTTADCAVFVHPETNLLHRAPTQPRRQRPLPQRRFEQIAIDPTHKLVKIDELWFVVTFEVVPDTLPALAAVDESPEQTDPSAELALGSSAVRVSGPEPRQCPEDIVLRCPAVRFNGKAHTFEREWGADIYAVSKKQANKKEIRRYTACN